MAAVAAYRDTPEDARNAPDVKTVADAFKKATTGLSNKEQTALLMFVLRVIQQPEEFNRNGYQNEKIHAALDKEIAKQFPEIVNDERIIIEANFLARAGITKEGLSKKLRQHRLFSIPDWIHKDPGDEYYPAFFVDPQYNPSWLEAVSMALRASPGERKYRFFTTADPALGNRTPLEVLISGELERVINAAKAFHRQSVTKLSDL